MKTKNWLICWFFIVSLGLGLTVMLTFFVDPFFHFHKPYTDKYFYTINNQRSQNDGICGRFEYDAMITGTSMVQNFRTTQMDELFGCHSIKIPFSGATYREISDNEKRALLNNSNLRIIVRALDMGKFYDRWDLLRTDLGDFPDYLYDDNRFNDIEYVLNKDVLFNRVYPMLKATSNPGFKPGITSFDDYARWQEYSTYGINTVCPEGITTDYSKEQKHLTDEEKEIIYQNICFNVTDVADQYPNVDFYCFYSPFSIVWWNELYNSGILYKQLEAEKYITELILEHDNIRLYSFNNRFDITTDLNNYKDPYHYAAWINIIMLKWMHDDEYRLTKDNYEDYLKQEYDFYTNFDFESINGQEDYEDDSYAATLLGVDSY